MRSQPLTLQETIGTPFNLSSPQGLLSTLQALRQTVETEGKATFDEWRSHIERPEFLPSALNLAEYLALRRHDLRALQAALKPWGLSSLGRIEARVMANLDAVITTLDVICGAESHHNRPPIEFFLEGDRLLIPSVLDLLKVNTPVFIDDGKVQSRVVDPQYLLPDGQLGLLLEVINASPKGVKLLPEKGMNFPDTVLSLSPLTEKDHQRLTEIQEEILWLCEAAHVPVIL